MALEMLKLGKGKSPTEEILLIVLEISIFGHNFKRTFITKSNLYLE